MARGWWPWPVLTALQDTMWGTCSHCGEAHWVVPVFVDHDDAGRPSGPFELLCVTCLRKDGELPPLRPGTV